MSRPFSKMTSENTALVIIDIINSCAHENCERPEWNIHFSRIRKMVPKLEKFIQDYRKEIGSLVIFGKTLPWQKEFLADNVNQLYEDEKYAYYTKDKSGFAEEFYQLQPINTDIVTEKNSNDALADPKLIRQLEDKNIKYIITTGVFTDGCVLSTVISGFSRGYNFVVLKDLVETTDSGSRQEIQQKLLEFTFPYMFARVTTSEDFLDGWNQ